MNGYGFLPGGIREIPGFDPDWQTVPLHTDLEGEEGTDHLELPVGAGETLPFSALVALSGTDTCAVTISAPQDSSGGFYIQGLNDASEYVLFSYGADTFSSPTAELWQVGIAGTLEGWAVLRIEGMVGAAAAGMLRITTSAGTIKAGSFLKGFRQHDARHG